MVGNEDLAFELMNKAKEVWGKETEEAGKKMGRAEWEGNKGGIRELENQRLIRGFFFFFSPSSLSHF